MRLAAQPPGVQPAAAAASTAAAEEQALTAAADLPLLLGGVRVVLVAPKTPANIGAVLRLAENFEVGRFWLGRRAHYVCVFWEVRAGWVLDPINASSAGMPCCCHPHPTHSHNKVPSCPTGRHMTFWWWRHAVTPTVMRWQ